MFIYASLLHRIVGSSLFLSRGSSTFVASSTWQFPAPGEALKIAMRNASAWQFPAPDEALKIAMRNADKGGTWVG